ncbi:hypothetical protein D7I39_10890 [Allopusillimonas ginsengisoli]|nr:hypothetical protein D7I39_10890 [Allopusillimonas ginsengisoli]
MKYEEIRSAITERMMAFPGLEQDRIVYPNQSEVFEPPEEGLWCRLNIQFGQAFMAGMADQPYTRKPGQIVVQCFERVRAGHGSLTMLADALEAHFAYWSSGDLECLEASQIVVGEISGQFQSNGFYQINVSIRFRAG